MSDQRERWRYPGYLHLGFGRDRLNSFQSPAPRLGLPRFAGTPACAGRLTPRHHSVALRASFSFGAACFARGAGACRRLCCLSRGEQRERGEGVECGTRVRASDAPPLTRRRGRLNAMVIARDGAAIPGRSRKIRRAIARPPRALPALP